MQRTEQASGSQPWLPECPHGLERSQLAGLARLSATDNFAASAKTESGTYAASKTERHEVDTLAGCAA